jgi:glycosyltransferase involved in cell wall biosynthesis
MTAGPIVLSINTSWNIVNFRSGLIRRLQAEGHRVVAVSPTDDHVPALAALGVEHVPIAIDSKGLSPLADLRLLADYRYILKRLRPAAYLGWTIKPNVWGSLAAHSLGIPVVNNVSGLGTAFIKVGPVTRVVQLLYRAAFARSATVFFQNRHDRDLFVDQHMVRAKQTALLPGSGIDLADFAPAPMPDHAPFAFLLVARLLRDKGVVEYVNAARMLRARYPDAAFRLLGGLGIANRTAIDRDTVEGWVAEGIVDYLGQADDVRPHLAAASAVVLPSYREGMPRSLLEGAAMARPLVATDVPGCTEIARTGENALLCEARSASSLAAAMGAMLDLSPEARAAMGARSRAIAEAEFDTRVVENRYLDALARAVARTITPGDAPRAGSGCA